MKKKGLSAVIVTLLLTTLAVSLIVIVGLTIRGIVGDEADQSKKCFGDFSNLGKVTFDSRNTCYNKTSDEIQFSIRRGDVEIDGISVFISSGRETVPLRLTDEERKFDSLRYYGGTYGSAVKLPPNEGTSTYVYGWNVARRGNVSRLEIRPVVGGTECSASDVIRTFYNCRH